MDNAPPLAGVRVLEMSTSAVGQVAGMLFADLGADVVRILSHEDAVAESDGPEVPATICWNRGKTTALLDAPTSLDDSAESGATGSPGVRNLLCRADILLSDGRPSELCQRGLDNETLSDLAPGLVHIWMPPVSASGRWSELPHDQLLLDGIGLFAAHHPGSKDQPIAPVVQTRLLIQGALGVVAALTGLIAREKDGWGRSATVSGLHAQAAALGTLVNRSLDGSPTLASGKLLPGLPNFRLYQTKDQKWLFLAALSPELFIKSLEALDRLDILARPDVAGDMYNVLRPEVAQPVNAELDAEFGKLTLEELQSRLSTLRVPSAAVSDPAEWLGSDVIAYACPPITREHPTLGTVTMPGTAIRFEINPAKPGDPQPLAGGLAPEKVWANIEPLPIPSGAKPGSEDLPLSGLRTIDLSTFLAGPFVSTLLASHGADVIKVEPPSRDPYSFFNAPYAVINERKPRVLADLTTEADRTRLLNLVAEADIVIDNLLTSSLERLDLGPEAFAGANPNLIRCSVTAYGSDGPYAELPGFDPIMQTLSGLVKIQGGDGQPVATTAPVHDIATACLATIGTLAALWTRDREGHGQRLFVSLAATSTFLQSAEFTTYEGSPNRLKGGPNFAGPSCWRRYYEASDRWIAVAATTPQQQSNLQQLLATSATTGVGDDTGNEDADLCNRFANTIKSRSAEHWLAMFNDQQIPSCEVGNRTELDLPFLVEQHFSHVVESPQVGKVECVAGFTDWHHFDRLPPLPVSELEPTSDGVLYQWRRSRDAG